MRVRARIGRAWRLLIGVGFGLLALAACQADGDDSNPVDPASADPTNAEIQRLQAELDEVGSKWMAAVATSRQYNPTISRLLAVDAWRRAQTPEAWTALGTLLFTDPRRVTEPVTLTHDSAVWTTRFSPDDTLLATGSEDGNVRLWRTGTDQLVTTLHHDDAARALAFAADAPVIATGSHDGSAILWSLDGSELARTTHDDRVNAVAVASNGSLLASASHDGTARLHTDGNAPLALAHDGAVWAIDLSPDGSLVITGSSSADEGTSTLWRVEDGAELARFAHAGPVSHVAFSPDGRYAFAGGEGNITHLIDVRTAESVAQPEVGFGISGVQWRPDGEEVAVWSLGAVRRLSAPGGVELARHDQAGGERAFSYSSDAAWMAAGSGDFAFSFGVVGVWDTQSGRSLVELNTGGPIESVDITSDGRWVAAGFRFADGAEVSGQAIQFQGRDAWVGMACDGNDGLITPSRWAEVVGPDVPFEPGCPGVEAPPPAPDASTP